MSLKKEKDLHEAGKKKSQGRLVKALDEKSVEGKKATLGFRTK